MDIPSFIDYFLVNELSKNADGFKKSVFFHKDKYSNGGKLKAGPVWDFDWSFKNQEYCYFNATEGEGWAHHINDCWVDNYSTGWYIRLLQDSTFQNELRCTYEQYRQTMLDTTSIFAYIDSIGAIVQNAQVRHFQKWSLLGHNGPDWELEPFPATYNAELVKLKDWINKRLLWLDDSIPGLCTTAGVTETDLSTTLNCYPNPANDYLNINYSLPSTTKISVRLFNFLGLEVLSTTPIMQSPGYHALKLETQTLSNGVYILNFERGKDVVSKKIIILK